MIADATHESERPNVEEMYQTASNTSNLTVEADRGGAGDVLIAAGWSESRIGMVLLRLHSEWDACEKPTRPTKESIKAMVGTFQRALPGDVIEGKPEPINSGQAHHYAMEWYAHEVAMLLGKLKALPDAREQIILKALRWRMGQSSDPITRSDIAQVREADAQMLKRLRKGVEDAKDDADLKAGAEAALAVAVAKVAEDRREEDRVQYERAADKVGAVIRYWLDQTCGSCHGLKWQLIPGTPALSNRVCPVCRGSGIGGIPHQQDGRKLANFMDDCVSRARTSLRSNLTNMRRARNKVVDTKAGYVIMPTEEGTGR